MPRRETSPEVHAAECGGGHKLSVMAVTKSRFLGRRGVDLPRNTLPQNVADRQRRLLLVRQSVSFARRLPVGRLSQLECRRDVDPQDVQFGPALLRHKPVEGRLLRFHRRSERDAKCKSQLPGPGRSPEGRDRGFHVGRLASGWAAVAASPSTRLPLALAGFGCALASARKAPIGQPAERGVARVLADARSRAGRSLSAARSAATTAERVRDMWSRLNYRRDGSRGNPRTRDSLRSRS